MNPYATPKSDPTSSTQAVGERGPQNLDAKACISRAWKLLNEFRRILLLVSLFNIVVALALGSFVNSRTIPSYEPLGFPEHTTASMLASFFSLLFGLFLWLGLTRTILKIVDHGPGRPRFRDLFSGGRFFLRYLAAAAFYYWAVVIGLILFVVPGLYLAMRLSFFTQAMIDRNLGPGEALRQSWDITQTSQRQIWFLYLYLLLVLLGGVLALWFGLIAATTFVSLAMTLAYRWLTSGSDLASPTVRTTPGSNSQKL